MITGVTASLTFKQGESVYYLLGEKFMALSYHLYYFSTQWTPPRLVLDETSGDMVPMTKAAIEHAEAIPYGTAVVLLGVVLLFNSLSISFRYYLRTHRKW